ncbi:MAG: hypothetical protein HY053_05910 [Proteobacteria bacterium]|nr:hypothetical protein [Pseudomonadota bacterium]
MLPPETSDPNYPHAHKSVTILAIALVLFALFQLTQALTDRVALSKAKTQMDGNMVQVDKGLEQGKKMMDQLNAVAIGTQKLADGGNANAKDILARLAKAGIKVNPNFKPGQPAAAATGAPPPAPTTP